MTRKWVAALKKHEWEAEKGLGLHEGGVSVCKVCGARSDGVFYRECSGVAGEDVVPDFAEMAKGKRVVTNIKRIAVEEAVKTVKRRKK